jgi:hypothetical protein
VLVVVWVVVQLIMSTLAMATVTFVHGTGIDGRDGGVLCAGGGGGRAGLRLRVEIGVAPVVACAVATGGVFETFSASFASVNPLCEGYHECEWKH